MSIKKLILVFLGIPLFLLGLIKILNGFQGQMNIVDTLVVDVAPQLPPQVGDLVRVLAIVLLVYFVKALPVAIENLAKEYL